jgi:hypothetical protein
MSKNAPKAFPVVTSPVVAEEVTARVGGLFGVERPAYSETARGRHPGRCALGKGFADPSEEFLLAFEQ